MKKKVSAMVVAIGVATTPVMAKQIGKRQARTESSNGAEKSLKNRIANSFKRFNLKKAEKEFLRETEEDIQTALKNTYNKTTRSVRI
ncbi:MAG: hypothetical protein MK132_16940 [Lentisphaerales bacterium]|nr:hypothetical protein [Lentisphaerales bacterium]